MPHHHNHTHTYTSDTETTRFDIRDHETPSHTHQQLVVHQHHRSPSVDSSASSASSASYSSYSSSDSNPPSHHTSTSHSHPHLRKAAIGGTILAGGAAAAKVYKDRKERRHHHAHHHMHSEGVRRSRRLKEKQERRPSPSPGGTYHHLGETAAAVGTVMTATNQIHRMNEQQPDHKVRNTLAVIGAGIGTTIASQKVHESNHTASKVTEFGVGATTAAVGIQEMHKDGGPSLVPVAAAAVGAGLAGYATKEYLKHSKSDSGSRVHKSHSPRRSHSPVLAEVETAGARTRTRRLSADERDVEAFVQHELYETGLGRRHSGRRAMGRAH